MAERTLVLMRHAKSDWSVDASDRERPITARGRRQAAEAGRWLAGHVPGLELVLSSPATRARTTWDVAGASYAAAPRLEVDDRAYTFDDHELLAVLHEIGDDVTTAMLVGHNPALDDLVARLAGERVDMVTSSLAVLRFRGPWSELGPGACDVVAAGRPPA
jgi:phosphohistidine phosphatase